MQMCSKCGAHALDGVEFEFCRTPGCDIKTIFVAPGMENLATGLHSFGYIPMTADAYTDWSPTAKDEVTSAPEGYRTIVITITSSETYDEKMFADIPKGWEFNTDDEPTNLGVKSSLYYNDTLPYSTTSESDIKKEMMKVIKEMESWVGKHQK